MQTGITGLIRGTNIQPVVTLRQGEGTVTAQDQTAALGFGARLQDVKPDTPWHDPHQPPWLQSEDVETLTENQPRALESLRSCLNHSLRICGYSSRN